MSAPTDRYDYAIHSASITPMGKITHVAKVTRMVDRKHHVDVPADQFGETWGESDADARAKMREAVEPWIAAQEP